MTDGKPRIRVPSGTSPFNGLGEALEAAERAKPSVQSLLADRLLGFVFRHAEDGRLIIPVDVDAGAVWARDGSPERIRVPVEELGDWIRAELPLPAPTPEEIAKITAATASRAESATAPKEPAPISGGSNGEMPSGAPSRSFLGPVEQNIEEFHDEITSA